MTKNKNGRFKLTRYNYLVLFSEILLMDGQGHDHCISGKIEKNKKLNNLMK